jgi:hypothetical protein
MSPARRALPGIVQRRGSLASAEGAWSLALEAAQEGRRAGCPAIAARAGHPAALWSLGEPRWAADHLFPLLPRIVKEGRRHEEANLPISQLVYSVGGEAIHWERQRLLES